MLTTCKWLKGKQLLNMLKMPVWVSYNRGFIYWLVVLVSLCFLPKLSCSITYRATIVLHWQSFVNIIHFCGLFYIYVSFFTLHYAVFHTFLGILVLYQLVITQIVCTGNVLKLKLKMTTNIYYLIAVPMISIRYEYIVIFPSMLTLWK